MREDPWRFLAPGLIVPAGAASSLLGWWAMTESDARYDELTSGRSTDREGDRRSGKRYAAASLGLLWGGGAALVAGSTWFVVRW